MKIIIPTLLACASSIAYASPLHIQIETDANATDVFIAKVRLKEGNNWTLLGEIYPGNNIFDIDTDTDNGIGSIWIEKSNDEKWVAHFNKKEGILSLHFKIDQQSTIPSPPLKVNESDNPTQPKISIKSENSLDNSKSVEEMVALYKLSPAAKNAWPANCNYFDWVFGADAYCAVAANPGFAFQSTDTTGGSLFPEWGAFGGNFESSYSASTIKESGGAYFDIIGFGVYAHANFYWGNNLAGKFDGGGVGVGVVKGKGRFF